MPEVPIGFPRAFAEFPDPADPDQVFRCDLTWLTSYWTCIFGQGCAGIYADRPDDGCCTLGAHFADADDEKRVGKAVRQLTPAQWQYRAEGRRSGWAEYEDPAKVSQGEPPDRKTRIVDGACIFLNRRGFPGGMGCALHLLARDQGRDLSETKPDVCWQLPLRRVDSTDELGHVTSTLREWKRRDWGEGGEDFAWWCTESDDAFVGDGTVLATMRREIELMCGDHVYELLLEALARRCASTTLLPHPAVRRRRTAGRRA